MDHPLADAEGPRPVEDFDDLGGQEEAVARSQFRDAVAMAGEFADFPSQGLVDVGDGLSEFLGLGGEECGPEAHPRHPGS
ncbi:hypothetical protein ACWCXK_26150 [Streptomyces sp. NPDC001739]